MVSDEIALKSALIEAAGRIASAYVTVHKSELHEIHEIIETAFRSLDEVQNGGLRGSYDQAPIDIESSITPEYLVCLEDGKKLKMLKRYLKTNYNMTPEEYRKRWNLPSDYPMVAPNYAKRRSELAKDIGLGKQSIKQRKQVAMGKFKSGLPAGKGKLRIVKSTDIMTARSIHPSSY